MNLLPSSSALQARRIGVALHAGLMMTAGQAAIEFLLPRPGAPER